MPKPSNDRPDPPSPSRGPGGKRPARGLRTRAVHGAEGGAQGPMSTPVVHSATFSFPSLDALMAEQDRKSAGSYYQRLGHPTVHALEERFAALEGSEAALLFPSGMAALAALFLSRLEAGDHVVALHQTYGGTREILEWGVSHFAWSLDLVDAEDPRGWPGAFRARTRLFHVESPTNPSVRVVDLARAAEVAHSHGAVLTVDNTVASPIGQSCLALGADLVMYSATKSIGGHSDLLAGVVAGSHADLEKVWKVRKLFGATPDPETAWLIERSLKTLPLRVAAANASALELATRLAAHPGVAGVFYPGLASDRGHEIARRQMPLGFGPLLGFEVRGGAPAALEVVNALELVKHGPSLGSVDTLAGLPGYTSHIQLSPEARTRAGIPEGMVRISVGIEDTEDLWLDLDQALARAATVRV